MSGQINKLVLKEMLRSKHIDWQVSFFFSTDTQYYVWIITIEGSSVVSFFWLNSPTTSLALSELFFFFSSKQSIGQANQTCLKRNAKVTRIDFFELLSWQVIGEQFFFFVDLLLQQSILFVRTCVCNNEFGEGKKNETLIQNWKKKKGNTHSNWGKTKKKHSLQ